MEHRALWVVVLVVGGALVGQIFISLVRLAMSRYEAVSDMLRQWEWFYGYWKKGELRDEVWKLEDRVKKVEQKVDAAVYASAEEPR